MLRGEVKQILFLVKGFFVDEEGKLSDFALRELVKARSTPPEKYISHEEVEKWFGKLSGTRKRSKS